MMGSSFLCDGGRGWHGGGGGFGVMVMGFGVIGVVMVVMGIGTRGLMCAELYIKFTVHDCQVC